MDEFDLVESPLSQTVEHDGHTVRVYIYSSGADDWILEVVDKDGTSTVWDETFRTDELAFREFNRTLKEDGIRSMVGPVEA